MTSKKLTPRQTLFVSEILIDGNAAQAAIRAGYAPKAAKEQGYDLLTRPHIAEAVAAKRAKRLQRNEVTADRVLQELARIAFFDVRKALNPDGSMKPLDQLDDDTAAPIAGLDLAELRDEDGSPIGVLKKIKIAEKLRALEMLGRHLGMFNDKLKISGDVENPLLVMIQRINGQGSAIHPVIEGVVAEYGRPA
jgi:phage terminase small subunit